MKAMPTYSPDYDTTIRTTTVIERHSTRHVDYIDWDNYPFDDPQITAGMSGSVDEKLKRVEQLKDYLRTCEQSQSCEAYATSYGGWPRIWQRVVGVGMVSQWPYWKPRPAVAVHGTLGYEWIDWASLTGAMIKEPSAVIGE